MRDTLIVPYNRNLGNRHGHGVIIGEQLMGLTSLQRTIRIDVGDPSDFLPNGPVVHIDDADSRGTLDGSEINR